MQYDSLTPTEQAVAQLHVDPNSLQPISWINDEFYNTLKQKGMLAPDLDRRIQAYRKVSSGAETSPF